MKYIVTATLTVHPGCVLGLTAEQARRREHALRSAGKGRYEVILTTQFKRGEVIESDLEPPKSMAQALEAAGKASKVKAPVANLASATDPGVAGETGHGDGQGGGDASKQN